MIILAIMLQTAPSVPVPPVAPPSWENYQAAMKLWQENAPSPDERRQAIDRAVGDATTKALASIGVVVTPGNIKSVQRWLPRFDRLRPLIARHVPTDLNRLDDIVAKCVTTDLAYDLSAEEIGRVRAFMQTPAGKKFWSASGIYRTNYLSCYSMNLNVAPTDADFRSVELPTPKPPKIRRNQIIPSD